MSSRKSLGDIGEEESRRNSQWQLDSITSVESRELSVSDSFYATNDLNLQVVQKKELTVNCPVIPATKCEKLTYIRSYVSFTSKTDVIGIQFINYNKRHYMCTHRKTKAFFDPAGVMNTPKGGLNILWVLIGVLQLFFSTYLQVLFLDFIISGLLYSYTTPWNGCTKKVFTLSKGDAFDPMNVSCFVLDEFIEKVPNATIESTSTGFDLFYDPATKDYFQISHFFNALFAKKKLKKPMVFGVTWFFIYYNIIWLSSSLLINQIFKKSIWKILHFAHWMLAVIYACVLIILYIYAATHVGLTTVSLESTRALKRKMVKLSTDSALIITSNTLFYLFRAYVVHNLLRYCVYITHAQLHLVYSDSNIFFLWPIFFSSFYVDCVMTIPFCILIFVVDYFTFIITHQCLIETIVSEWQAIKRWQAAVILFILSNLHKEQWFEVINWLILYGIRAATCTELIIITFIYPLSRLLEDITFHNGIAPSFVVKLGLELVCLYYMVKLLRSSSLFGDYLSINWRTGLAYIVLLILTAGLLIKLYDIIVTKNKSWKLIFVPVKNWGPFDLTLRLFRKKYDSSKYIQSQAPRDLSRYMIQKAEPKSYKLDIRYGPPPKSALYVRSGSIIRKRIKI